MIRYKSHNRKLARQLRRNQTPAEHVLWYHVRRKRLGVRFLRQRPIGPFIVDFFAPAAYLVVELDGGQHFDKLASAADAARDRWLRSQGLTVLRFTNDEIDRSIQAVLETIWDAVASTRIR